MLAGVAAAILVAVGAFVNPLFAAAGLALGVGAAGVAGARVAVFMRRRIAALEHIVRDQRLAAEGQLSSLAALSSELRLDEVLDRIIASASSAIAGAQFALLITDLSGMRTYRHTGIPPESLGRLKSWAGADARGCWAASRS